MATKGAEEYSDKPANMPALGGASAEPLRFMDFLIRDPVRSILLHGAGISVVIPDPCRYAVHKLIIAGRRQNDAGGQAKRDKDLRQAGILFEALPVTGHGPSLADALEEAWDRGPAWEAGDLGSGRNHAQGVLGRYQSNGWHSQAIKVGPPRKSRPCDNVHSHQVALSLSFV